MVVSLSGVTVAVRECEHCDTGRLVRDADGTILGHYQRGGIYSRAGVVFEVSSRCPGRGNRAYGGGVVAPFRSAAIMKAIRRIIEWRA